MGLLDSLLGNPQQKQDYQGFVNRYQQGAPAEGYTDQEVQQRYTQVAPQLPPEDYQRAAEDAFTRMTPDQRAQFGQYVSQQTQPQQIYTQQQYQDPRALAQMTTQVHQQQPGFLGGLLGGGGGGGSGLGGTVARAALAGITAMAVSNAMGGALGGGMGGGLAGGLLGNVVGGALGGNSGGGGNWI